MRILAKGTGVPIRRATVKGGSAQQFTDPDGKVSIAPTADATQVEISRNGYKTLIVSLSDLKNSTSQDYFLFPGTPDDNEVIIKGTRRQEVSKKVISVAETRALVPSGDPVQITKLLPGVQAQAFRPEIIVRGSGPNDTKYYIDRLEVPYLFHPFGNISVIEPNQLSEVEFYTGGFGAQFGNAMGGIVVLRTKDEIPERPFTDLTVNLPFYSAAYHEHPISDHESIAVAIRRSYIDFFLNRFVGSRIDSTIVPYFGDAQAVYQDKEGDSSRKFSVLASYDGLKLITKSANSTQEDGRNEFNIYNGFTVLGYEMEQKLNEGWQYNATPQYAWTKIRQSIVDFTVNIDNHRVGAPIEATKRLSSKEKLYVGLDPAINYFAIDVVVPDTRSNDPTQDFEEAPRVTLKRFFRIPEIAAWLAADKQVGDLTVTPGVRPYYNAQIKRTSIDPRVSARYALNGANSIKGSLGQFSQDPGQGAEASEEFGNPNLDYQRSIHYVLGVETTWNDLWNTDFQLFHKKAFKLIQADPDTKYNNDGSLRSSGFEAFIRRNPTARMFGWLSYTYSVTEERKSDEVDFGPAKYDQTHVANLASNYRFTGQFQLGSRLGYHTGDRFTPVTDSVFNANLDKYQKRPKPTDTNASRLPPFTQLDLFLQNDVLFDTSKLIFRYGVQTLAAERPVYGVQYNYDYSKEEFFRGIPPIPYIEVKGQF